jgi:two-component system response regulator YesN
MEHLIIVDDDEIICDGLHYGIKWEEHGITVVGTAYDGETAIKLIREYVPDIILLDINLPLMDGLELAKVVGREYPKIKIIMLTACEEFQFAQQAVKLHVYDYLTKPLDNHKVVEAVGKAQECLVKEREQNEKLTEGFPLVREKYLKDLITRNLKLANEAKIAATLQFTAESFFGVGLICLKNKYLDATQNNVMYLETTISDVASVKLQIVTMLDAKMDSNQVIGFNRSDDEVALIFKDFASRASCENYMNQIALLIQAELDAFDDQFITICLGTPDWGFDGIAASYEQAKKLAGYSWYFENHSIIRSNDIVVSQEEPINIDDLQKAVVAHLKLGEAQEVFTKAEELFNTLRSHRGIYFSYIRMAAVSTVILAYQAIEVDAECRRKLTQSLNHMLPQVLKVENLDELEKWLKCRLTDIMAIVAEKKKSSGEKIIDQAIQYIEVHFANPDLTLDDVAGSIHISPTYFSALFKQMKNINFSDYLETVRINKAMELFTTTELRIYEVAEQVGYNSPQYFSICFKKMTNLTPSEYRTRQK